MFIIFYKVKWSMYINKNTPTVVVESQMVGAQQGKQLLICSESNLS